MQGILTSINKSTIHGNLANVQQPTILKSFCFHTCNASETNGISRQQHDVSLGYMLEVSEP